MRTGENAFQAMHGVDVWTQRRDHPEENAIFNHNMTTQTTTIAAAVAEAYDFADLSTVVDVGGGQGALLEAVLTRHPQLTGHGVRPGARGRGRALLSAALGPALDVGERQLLRGGARRPMPIC